MNGVDCSIVIVSYKVASYLEACLASIGAVRTSSAAVIETIVIDNDSADGTVDMVRSRFPWVELHELKANLGFGAANNIGAERARGRHLMFLNPDTELRPGAVETLLEAVQQWPAAGIVAPRLDNPDGSLQVSCYRFHSLSNLVLDGTPLRWMNPFGHFGAHRFCDPSSDDPRQVDWACGACLLMQADLFWQLDGFDERFFMYSEDVDLCLRATQAGRRVVYVPGARVLHHGNRSEKEISPAVLERVAESLQVFFRKHHPRVPSLALAAGAAAGAVLGRFTGALGVRLRPGAREPIRRKLHWQTKLARALVEAERRSVGPPPGRRRSRLLGVKSWLKSQSSVARRMDALLRGCAAAAIAALEALARMRRLPSLDETRRDIRSVVVLGFYGIGDSIMMTPALADLRHALPRAQVRVICSRRTAPVFEQNPAVDHVQCIDEADFFRVARSLRSERIDLYVMLHSNLEYYLFGWLAGARYRIGYLWDYRAVRTSGCRAAPVPNADRSAVRRAVKVPALLGAGISSSTPRVFLTPQEDAAAARFLRDRGVPPGARVVAVNANKTAAWLGAGRWPDRRWRAVIRHLRDRHAAVVLVLGGPGEAKEVARLLAPLPADDAVMDLSESTTLRMTAAILRRSELLVTTDSGLMHLAGAVGTPAVSLFMFSDVESFQSGDRNMALYQPVACSPCILNGFAARDHYPPICAFDYRCSRALAADDVITAVDLVLERSQAVGESLE